MKKIKTKEIQKLELDMLIELDKFCKKNKINYFLGCGTLAGAILEKGFFPWDDDIDVLMKRSDYEKFIKLYKNDKYNLMTCHKNKDYYYPYAKLIDNNTTLYECKNKIEGYGIFIDIFPLDTASNRIYLFFIKILMLIMMSTWGCYLDDKNIFIKIIYKILSIITYIFPRNFFAKLMDNICKRNNKDKYNLMGVICFHKYKREIMDKDIFKNKIKVTFEGYKFTTMKEYHKYLNNLYIDYNIDNSDHGHKHFDAYWK